MDRNRFYLLGKLNQAVIQLRGIYSAWSGSRNISYNEMLVLYTIREKGFCVQKQLCDSYLLPRQTINHVIGSLRRDGILQISETHRLGREKAFVLTPKGERYARPLLDALDDLETRALELFGDEKLDALTSLMLEYVRALGQSLEESR